MTQFLNLDGLKYYHSKIKAYVDGKVSDLEGALKYEGTIGSTGATITALPTAATANKGYVYIVKTAGTYVGANEVGDLLISNGVEWTAVNGENQVSDNNPTLAWGTKSKVGTIDGVDLNVTMPANPNTDTKVTSVANHYTPSGGSDGVTLSGTIG
jgi:hypothetical protein